MTVTPTAPRTEQTAQAARTARTARTTVLPLTALDGRPLTLVHVEGPTAPSRGPVLLAHGAGVRAELFRPPVERSVVDALLDAGWDVWLVNWRASIDLDPVPWTLDEAAAYDHPAAVREVVRLTGSDRIKAVVHCQGSASFTMAAVAGLLPEVDTVVTNAVSLHPVIPAWSRFKISRLAPLVGRFTPYLSPGWADHPEGWVSRWARLTVRLTHRECSNLACRLVSFTYGAGAPALWSHQNLSESTHDWVRGEFGEVPFTFFDQMARSVDAGILTPVSQLPGLPSSYTGPPQTDARFVFLAGADNRCFLAESQVRSHAHFAAHRPRRGDTLHVLPGYGHLDVFLGSNAARDVFPLILDELAR